MTGTISRLEPSQFGQRGGWRNIRPDKPGVGTVYFGSQHLERTTKDWADLAVGDRVAFTLIAHPSGPRAIGVRCL